MPIDINELRDYKGGDPAKYRKYMEQRFKPAEWVDEVVAKDEEWRVLTKEVEDLKQRYRAGRVGDVEVKEKLTIAINNFLDPIRERRAEIEADSGYVEQVIHHWNDQQCDNCRETQAKYDGKTQGSPKGSIVTTEKDLRI